MNLLAELIDDAKFIARYRKKYVPRQKDLDRQAPKAGEMAPDFSLWDVTGSIRVRLSDFRGRRPVVLVFGSYT